MDIKLSKSVTGSQPLSSPAFCFLVAVECTASSSSALPPCRPRSCRAGALPVSRLLLSGACCSEGELNGTAA